MLKPPKSLQVSLAPLGGLILIATAATQLTGCVVRAGVAVPAPPPPPVYVAPAPAPAAEDIQANEAPPPLPVYPQPPCPVEGYIWTPGYWAWAPAGYYWVPGTWVAPPRVGLLWTPGYWGFVGGVYMFHAGYWGPHVGFYGGVNYGFGYGGVGFAGGRWVGNSFAYNQSVTNVNVTVVHNTYNETVGNNVTVNRVSYNGGAGGIAAAPTAQERMAAQEQHVQATPEQHQHVQQAAASPALLAKNNGGRPSIAATQRPSAFNAPGAVGAHGATPPPPHAPAAAYTNHNGTGAGHGAAAAQATGHGGGGAANGKPAAPKANAKHPKAPPKGEEKTAQR
jgi:hypothetical protein